MRRESIKPSAHTGKMKFPRGNKSSYHEEGDFGPHKISMKRTHIALHDDHRGDYPEVQWGPIRRFLKAHKGQNWDQVYSEICKMVDPRTFVGQHFKEWISHMVDKNCFVEKDGRVYNEHGHETGLFYSQFYIHPDTKTLEWVEPHRRHRREQYQTVFDGNAGQLYHCHNGIWYRVEFKKVEKHRNNYGSFDHLCSHTYGDVFISDKLATMVYNWPILQALKNKYGLDEDGDYRYCVKKKSANGKEIEKLKQKYGWEG